MNARPIRRLSEETVSRIAAGEVIERPLSVVKELMENSIDAGATEIAVELDEAGNKLIRLSDNGCGMSADDARLSIHRHTTSKISGIDDLSSLGTLGFRGEALYSIAAVSRMTITTCRPGDEVGFRLVVEGGTVVADEPAARNPGTTIEAENLFFNLPARQKFLKSPRSEIQAITQFFLNFALSFPGVRFRLANNGIDAHNLEPVSAPIERVRAITGREIAARLQESACTLKRMSLNAIFSPPDFTFPNRRLQIFFVNGRLVRDRRLSIAVDTAYKGMAPGGRYPLSVLFLEVPPEELDANVHPAKTEVRFEKPHEVHSLVYRTIRSRFVAPEREDEDAPRLALVAQPVQSARSAAQSAQAAPLNQRELTLDAQAPPEASDARASSRKVEVIGQFHDTFILAHVDGTPFFIDQHIASERIIYNRLKSSCASPPSQLLLLSEPVETPHYVYAILMDNIDRIKSVGIEIEPFGERAFVIRSVVHNTGHTDSVALLSALANELSTAPFKAPENVLLDRLLTTASCKMAVQGGKKLTREEMQSLVEEYIEQDARRTCPHGRPIMFELTREAMNAWFKR